MAHSIMETTSGHSGFRLLAGSATIAGIVLLVALSARGSADRGVVDAIADLARDPWGLATLADLALGLVFVAIWMALVEARPRRLLLWLPLLACLGNIATGVFLLMRLRHASNLRTWLTEKR